MSKLYVAIVKFAYLADGTINSFTVVISLDRKHAVKRLHEKAKELKNAKTALGFNTYKILAKHILEIPIAKVTNYK